MKISIFFMLIFSFENFAFAFVSEKKSPLKGLLLNKEESLDKEEMKVLRDLKRRTIKSLNAMKAKESFPKFDQFLTLFPELNTDKDKGKIYEREKVKFYKKQEIYKSKIKESSKSLKYVEPISDLCECCSNSCPWNRKYGRRNKIDQACEKQFFKEIEQRIVDENETKGPLVITFFGSGGLFHESLILLKLKSLLKKKKLTSIPIEINIIDTSYSRVVIVENQEIYPASVGLSIIQFNKIVNSIFADAKVYVYTKSSHLIEDVLVENRYKTQILVAINFGDESFEYDVCSLELELITLLALEDKSSSVLKFPYEYKRSSTQIFSNKLGFESHEKVKKIFYQYEKGKNSLFYKNFLLQLSHFKHELNPEFIYHFKSPITEKNHAIKWQQGRMIYKFKPEG